MMMLDYKGGRGVKNLGKSYYVLCECFLTGKVQEQALRYIMEYRCSEICSECR